MPKERQPGCICELNADGEPVVLGYAMCPVHKPEIYKRPDPIKIARSLSAEYLEITDRIYYVVESAKEVKDPIANALQRIDRANECAVLCLDKIIASHTDKEEIEYWNEVRSCFKDQVGE